VYNLDSSRREKAKGEEEKNKNQRTGNPVYFLPGFSIADW